MMLRCSPLEPRVADYFEQAWLRRQPLKRLPIGSAAILFALLNQAGQGIEEIRVKPEALAGLIRLVATGDDQPEYRQSSPGRDV